ncbi:MAG: hypothetical protein MJA82_02905 [Clostridia bacterium]|nr:hypothetical protein [Clostridia bacterium]
MIYRDRSNVRDSLDAAVTAALSVAKSEEAATYLYERKVCVERDSDGNCIRREWRKRERNYKEYVSEEENLF